MQKVNNLFSRVYKKEPEHKTLVLGINASPRAMGNSEILLEQALQGASSAGGLVEKIRINDYKFVACQACEHVRDDGYCSINDDFQKIYRAIQKAEIIFLSSPIYFGSLSAQAKMLIDRFQCHWQAANVRKTYPNNLKKKGYFFSVQAQQRDDFFANAVSIVRNFFAAAGIEYCGELLCPEVEAKGSINKFPDKLKQAFSVGEKLVQQL
jgi:multimeric flavodoxin WrbA